MHPSFLIRLLGILLLLFALSLLPPIALSLLYDDGQREAFLRTLAFALVAGGGAWSIRRPGPVRLRTRDGFLVVTLYWLSLSTLGSLPFLLCLNLSPADAFFESVSAVTTTGATVLAGLDAMPPSLLYYRQQLQWLGGIGVVVTAVALLPMLGIGGMQLLKAETAGPVKDEKLTPRVAHTARIIWHLYGWMTLLCILAFWLAGMSLFDAVGHAFATVSTGGFSTHDASFAYFDSPLIEQISVLFMLLGAISFNVHFLAVSGRSPEAYWRSLEARVFLLIVAGLVGVVTVLLWLYQVKGGLLESLRYASFTVVTVITSTGYAIDDFSLWPGLLPVLLIFSSFIGGCSGSTAGGMKVIRIVLLAKQAARELHQLVHPRMVRPVMLQGRVVRDGVVSAVWGFFAIYVACFVLFILLLMADGLDQVSAFGAAATCMNNMGPGLGEVAVTFIGQSDFTKWLMSFAMLLGRLEIFTILVLFTPAFWRS